MSFVSDFLEMTEESEAPRSFFYWSALAGISAVVKRNVWVNRYLYKNYPNIYVLLIAKSGMRKGVSISLVKDLVNTINNTRVISGRASIQGIIKDLATAMTKPDGSMITNANGFIVSSEFASSLVQDPQALTILTDLYDSSYHDEWRNSLKGSGVEILKEPCITMLAACNQSHFQDFVSPTAVTGGFVGRTMLIFESRKARINPLTRPPKIRYDKDRLLTYLKEVAKVKGEMRIQEQAIQNFEEWYHDFESREHMDKTGSAERVADNVMKVATLISLSRSPDLEITVDDMEESLRVCTTSLSHVNKTTAGQGKAQFAPQTMLVLQELLLAPNNEMSRMKLLQRNYGDIDSFDLDRVIDSLIQSRGVEQEKRGADIIYRLTKTSIQRFNEFVRERSK